MFFLSCSDTSRRGVMTIIHSRNDPIHYHYTTHAVSARMDNIAMMYSIQHIVVAGDFNFGMRNSDTTSRSRKPRAAAVLNTIINHHDLYDAGAIQSPFPGHTYFRHRNEQTSARYDRFHISLALLESSTYRILPRTGDHAPIYLSTAVDRIQRNWKFTDEHLGKVTQPS